jgi:hypothetical protein
MPGNENPIYKYDAKNENVDTSVKPNQKFVSICATSFSIKYESPILIINATKKT